MSANDLPETVTINKSEYEQLKLDVEELKILVDTFIEWADSE